MVPRAHEPTDNASSTEGGAHARNILAGASSTAMRGRHRQKPSGIAAKETIGKMHLIPKLGSKRLDEVTTEDIQRLKRHLDNRASKTVNNVLTVLNVLLKKAVE